MTLELSPDQLLMLVDFPAALPPDGVTANFVDPESRASVLIGVGAFFVAIMVVFVLARLYTKAFIIRKGSWDDCTFSQWLLRDHC